MKLYNKNNLENAKKLRKNMTPWERKLWFDFLITLPIKIYKQRPVGNYIIDFYCPKQKLAIELDGSQHYNLEDKIYDENRDEFLKSIGINVVRYSNLDIDKNFKSVCEDLLKRLKI